MSKNSVISTRHRHLDTGVNVNHFDNSRSGAATFHATRNFTYNFLLVTRKILAHRLTVLGRVFRTSLHQANTVSSASVLFGLFTPCNYPKWPIDLHGPGANIKRWFWSFFDELFATQLRPETRSYGIKVPTTLDKQYGNHPFATVQIRPNITCQFVSI